jgi:hypothetical protein
MHKRVFLLLVLVLATACNAAGEQTPFLVTLTPAGTAHTLPSDTPLATDTDQPTEPTTEPGTTAVDTATVVPTDMPVPLPTDTPAPTDTPSPTPDPWPIARDVPGASKMGIHVILNDDPRIMEWVSHTKPAVVKGLDNLDWLEEVKRVSPQTITIGRYTVVPDRSILDDKDPSQYPNPADFARNFVDTFIAQYRAHPGVDYWEGWNEFPPNSPAQWRWFAEFEMNRACIMNDLGLKAAIGGFSTGKPEYVEMGYFFEYGLKPVIQRNCNAIFTLHEYSNPTLQTGVGYGIPGVPANVHIDTFGSLTLRYRFWYEGYLKPAGLTIPLVISEAGIDNGVSDGVDEGCNPTAGSQGWYICYDKWDQMGLGEAKWSVYLEQLKWYDNELRKDNYVRGFTIFTAGTSNVDQWRTFNINDLLVPMAHYMNSQ